LISSAFSGSDSANFLNVEATPGTSVSEKVSPSSFFPIFLSLFCSAFNFLKASATSEAPIVCPFTDLIISSIDFTELSSFF
jgi:hypothetical protein